MIEVPSNKISTILIESRFRYYYSICLLLFYIKRISIKLFKIDDFRILYLMFTTVINYNYCTIYNANWFKFWQNLVWLKIGSFLNNKYLYFNLYLPNCYSTFIFNSLIFRINKILQITLAKNHVNLLLTSNSTTSYMALKLNIDNICFNISSILIK